MSYDLKFLPLYSEALGDKELDEFCTTEFDPKLLKTKASRDVKFHIQLLGTDKMHFDIMQQDAQNLLEALCRINNPHIRYIAQETSSEKQDKANIIIHKVLSSHRILIKNAMAAQCDIESALTDFRLCVWGENGGVTDE